jgi:ATP/maltotriose-dependent transcriptional regulator MalT
MLAAGTLALQGLQYQRLVRAQPGEVFVLLVAVAFLAMGISPRELAELQELAAGHSNNEIADRLHVSPHTVKTHIWHLFDKLGARRRTKAIRKARELGIVR